jgi:hypothetical protein
VSGHTELEAFISRVEGLRTLNADVAKAAEKPVADVARASAAKGQAPDGTAWAPKAEGGQALAGAAGAIESSTKGSTIKLTIGPPYAFHNWGAGGSSTTKGAERERKRTAKRQADTGTKSKFHAPKRQILPSSDAVPAAMREAIAKVAERLFGRSMGGR